MARYVNRQNLRLMILGAVMLAIALLAWRLYNPPALYRVTVLPSIAAQALNDRGQIVGIMRSAGSDRVFLWDRENGIRDLGLEAGGGRLMINNAGQISGKTGPAGEAFLWEPDSGRITLGTPNATLSLAHAMNNLGQVIGTSTAFGRPCGFLWDKATGMTRLTTPDGRPCCPVSINDARQILVESLYPDGHWFLLDPNGSKSLDAVLSNAHAYTMNANAWMAGVDESNPSRCRLLVWDERGHVKCRVAVGYPDLTRLNDRNQIAYIDVGHDPWGRLPFRLPHHRSAYMYTSYLWDPVRGRILLDRHLRGIRDFEVVDLNNNACIVGMAEMKDGSTRSVLLEPIPERWVK